MLREQVRPRTSKVRSCYVFSAQVYGATSEGSRPEQHCARGACRALWQPCQEGRATPRCPPARQAQAQGPSPPWADSAPVPSWHPDPLPLFSKRWAGTFGNQTAPWVQAGFLNWVCGSRCCL